MIDTSYACRDCIDRFIGPALVLIIRTATPAERDRCYGCGRDDRPVLMFTYDPDLEYPEVYLEGIPERRGRAETHGSEHSTVVRADQA